jgi:hypothetical protein
MMPLTKTQKDQLAAIVMATVGLMGALWYFGVQAKESQLIDTDKKTDEVARKLHTAEAALLSSNSVSGQLAARSELMAKREAALAPDRDAYAWIINTFNNFIQTRPGVNIYSYTQPEVSDVGVLPGFPYKWATFHLKGFGYYYEFGRFFADLENTFPYYQVRRLDITTGVGAGGEPEKLNYSFDLVVPVAPSDTK